MASLEEESEKKQGSSPQQQEPPLVLVTGVTGFIGSHIVHQLLTQGKVRVRGSVRSLANQEKVQALRDLVPDAKYPLELVEGHLDNGECWRDAVNGCQYVYHVASPVPTIMPNDENEVIRPAVEGTLNVLKACAECGTVKRVVVTSSIVAIMNTNRISDNNGEEAYVFSENDWSDPTLGNAYDKSKHLAEKAAWDFMEKLEDSKKFELVTCNPGAVIGPIITPTSTTTVSFEVIRIPITAQYPFVLNLNFPLVDVRDVAAGHIAAMEKPEAAGNRYILNDQSLWLREISQVIAQEFNPQGYRVTNRVLPNAAVWLMKFFNPFIARMYPLIGKTIAFNNDKMKTELGIVPRDIRQSIIDTAYSLIEYGVVPKTPGYKGQTNTTTE